jgi:hypothetical protein
MTSTQIKELIQLKIEDQSEITAVEHREVELALVDYIDAIKAAIPKIKLLQLDFFAVNRNYSLNTDIPLASVITGAYLMLECKVANNGFVPGDTVTAPTPYPADSGRTAAHGMAVQYNNASTQSVKIVVNDQLTLMTAFSAISNAPGSNIVISGSATSNWVVKVFINYV